MSIEITWALAALFGLGLFHGLNPGMGWLFAVALGIQERKRSAVLKAIPLLALGHALAVALAVAVAVLLGDLLPSGWLRWIVAGFLLALGVYRLVRARHPRYGGMRVRGHELVVWSFLMATAHGAGLMAVPFVVGVTSVPERPHAHHHSDAAPAIPAAVTTPSRDRFSAHAGHGDALAALPPNPVVGLAATATHTLGYLAVMGLLAVCVYEWLGLRLLRTLWVNLDLAWSAALIATAILTPFV